MNAIRLRHTALAALIALIGGSAQAGVLDSLFGGRRDGASEPARPGQRNWRLHEFSYLKLVPIEAGADKNDHPARIDPEHLRALLASAKLTQQGSGEPLFGATELTELAEPLSQALSVAGPGDDVTLLSTDRRGEGFLSPALAVTARVFVKDGQLNLVARDTRREFMSNYRGTQVMPTFDYGTRGAASGAVLSSTAATSVRPDWLRFSLQQPAPAAAATIAPAALPAARPVRDDAFYEAQEQRLLALKRLFDKGLITEAEYQQQRRAVVSGL